MAVWSAGDIITVYEKYVSKVLAATAVTTTQKATLNILQGLGSTRLTVVSTGTADTGAATLYYIEVTPEGGYKNVRLYFDSDAMRDRAFREKINPGSLNQTGDYCSSPNSTPGLDSYGLFNPLTQVSSGATANGADGIGSYTEIATGTTPGDAAYWCTTVSEDLCRFNSNPYMSLTFLFDTLGAPRFFSGLAVTNADPVANVLVDNTPTVGVAGIWFESGTDTNFQFVSNGTSGALTKIDTGIVPVVDRLYLLELLVSGKATASKSVNFWLRDLGTYTVGHSGNLLASGSATGTAIMGASDDLMMINGCVVASGTTATELRSYWGSIELNP